MCHVFNSEFLRNIKLMKDKINLIIKTNSMMVSIKTVIVTKNDNYKISLRV